MRLASLEDWSLSGSWPYTALADKSMETGAPLAGVTGVIPARVPGSVYADLLRAGLISDPYFETDSLKCEWVANRWWVYQTEAELTEGQVRGKRLFLVLSGVDYKARVYVNGVCIATHEGMNIPCRAEFTDRARPGKNIFRVVLEHAPDEMSQIGYTSMTKTQKARFCYKWDFATRLVNLGLYDHAWIEADEGVRIAQKQVFTEKNILTARVWADGRAPEGTILRAGLSFNGAPAAKGEAVLDKEGFAEVRMRVLRPLLWHPNGNGPQNLYDLVLSIEKDGRELDKIEQKTGFRTVKYLKNENAPEDALPYTLEVNGKRTYMKGVNLTPLDHMYGCVDYDRYKKLLTLAKSCGINLIRVWGGGFIEKEEFYGLCDELGLMVWQEFTQSSSGIENIPSKDPHFLMLMEKAALCAVKEKRNHLSLVLWSGGNELMDAQGVPSTYEDENIAMLKKICDEHDPGRLMLPTSASGPTQWMSPATRGRHHDVHGPWKYEGTEGQYKFFNESDSLLHSEFGCDGMSNLKSIKTVLSKENQKVTTIAENPVWRHHGEWWDTYAYRDRALFGELSDLEEYIELSQYMQAEAIRYGVESNRRRVWQNSGSIIWQFNEPWPNVSCTCLADFYCRPKLALRFFAGAIRPRMASLRYEKLIYSPGEGFEGQIFAHNDGGAGVFPVAFTARDENGGVISRGSGKVSVAKESCREALRVGFEVPAGEVFFLECSLFDGKREHKSRYMFFSGEKGRLSKAAVREYYRGAINKKFGV